MDYSSRVVRRSAIHPDVEFEIARMSLARRIELGKRLREIDWKGDFLAASDRLPDQIEAGVLQRQMDRLYVEWGLAALRGLRIDGEEATAAALIERGPEDLAREIAAAVRSELLLGEEERKN